MIDIASLPKPTPEEAARFLGHATLGYTRAELNDLVARGYDAWFKTQFAIAPTKYTGHFAWLKAKFPYSNPDEVFYNTRLTNSALRRYIEGADTLRQKLSYSLSQILVTSLQVGVDINWRQYAGAGYLDLLTSNAFGTYRNLVGEVTKSPLMSLYLTFLGSQKATATRSPDENYARELLQLFTIGVELLNVAPANNNPTGLPYGAPIPGTATSLPPSPYPAANIPKLARFFTGYEFNYNYSWSNTGALHELERYNYANQNSAQTPLVLNTDQHEKGETVLNIVPGLTFAVGGTSDANMNTASGIELQLKNALDYIFKHPNVAPFISRQLIQRFVTSNPDPEYLRRVAAVFTATGGNLSEVVKAVLMDESLFNASKQRVGGLTDATFGKLREPFVRLVQWGRATGATSISGGWDTPTYDGGIWNPSQLGQAPLMATSVFNFYRPGYVPPGSLISKASPIGGRQPVAPEMQITDEVSTVAYLNFMSTAIDTDRGVSGMNDIRSLYSALIPLASNPTNLVAELNLLFAAGRLNSVNKTRITQAISTLPQATAVDLRKRVQTAVLMVMAAPEYIVQK
jgi:uncharacterized protein (DUF1800 family)